jgi:hypothetical protein
MPTIQPYEQQVLPQGFDTSHADPNTVNTGAGFIALGQGADAAGTTLFRVQEQQEAASAQAEVASLRTQATKDMLDAENSAKPGDMGYAERFGATLQQKIDAAAGKFNTVRGKDVFMRSAAQLQASFTDRALGYQQQLAGQQAIVDFNTTKDADSRTLMMDPSQYAAVKQERTEQIMSGQGNYGHLNMAKRAELVSQINQSNAWATNYAMIQADPEGWMKRTGVESGVNRINGVAVGGVPGASSSDGFTRAMAFVFPHEGGYNKNDGNGHPVNLGINQGANPDVDVKNLTQDQATQLYRQRYWNAIGGDKMAPGVSLFAMDTAVNMGVGAAKEMLAATGGNLQQMATWREQRYRDIASANPDKAKYLNTWLSRNKDAMAAAAGGGTAAAGAATDPQVQVTAARLNPTLSDLSPQQFVGLVNHAETLQNQQMAVNKAQLEQDWKNQMSQAMTTGQVSAPIPIDRFIKSYGAAEGTRKYNDEYKPALELGQQMQNAYGQTVQQQDATLASLKPAPDAPGYDAAQKRYETFATAVNNVRRAREQDPIGFAIQQKIGGVQPLDMTTPDHMAEGAAARVAPAKAIQRDFGVPQLTLMSAPEAEGMKRAFGQMPSSQQIGYLAALQSKVNDPEAFRAIVSQIAPDSPETQVAAHLVNEAQPTTVQTHWFRPDETVSGRDAAALILEGKQLLNRSKETSQNDGKSRGFPMPKDQDLRQAFFSNVGNAFAGNEPAYEAAYQSVRAYYAGKAARLGKLDSQDAPDTKMVEEAVKAVTGGTYEQLGQTVIKPYGMKDQDFRTALMANGRAALTAAGLKDYAADPTAYRLMGAGDGQYWVMNGTEPVRGTDGSKVLIDVNQKPQAAPATVAPTPTADKGQRVTKGRAGR